MKPVTVQDIAELLAHTELWHERSELGLAREILPDLEKLFQPATPQPIELSKDDLDKIVLLLTGYRGLALQEAAAAIQRPGSTRQTQAEQIAGWENTAKMANVLINKVHAASLSLNKDPT